MNVNYNKIPMLSILLRERKKCMQGMFQRYANICVTNDKVIMTRFNIRYFVVIVKNRKNEIKIKKLFEKTIMREFTEVWKVFYVMISLFNPPSYWIWFNSENKISSKYFRYLVL